jgi:hypothetical protein
MSWIELSRWAREAPVVVVGLGVSFAIAELLALRLRRDGAIAWAQPDEVPVGQPGGGLRVLRVSRSARAWSGVPADALVSEEEVGSDVVSWTLPASGVSGPVADVHFAGAVCRGIGPSREPLLLPPEAAVVALDGPAEPIRSLLAACALKGMELPLVVTSIDQLGHGAHMQLLRRRGTPLVLVSGDRALGAEVGRWCRATDCPFLLRAPTTSCVTAEVFQVVAEKLVGVGTAGPAWAPSVEEDSLRHRVQAVREREVTS